MGDIPEGWSSVSLEVLLPPGGLFDGPFGSNLKTSDYTSSGVRVIRLENLGPLRFNLGKQAFISKSKYQSLRKHTVTEGDILFGSFVDGPVRVCLLPHLDTPAIAKADCYTIRPRQDLVDRKFLAFQLGSPAVHNALLESIHGATRPRITTKQLRALSICLCPLSEQKRVVAKIEELLAHVSAARACLERVSAILKRFRQSVLAAACAGRVTEDWRGGRSNELPWGREKLESLAVSIEYGFTAPARAGVAGPRFLRITDIQRGKVDWDEVPTCGITAKDETKFRLSRGDILFARTGATTGKSFLIETCPRSVFASYLIRVRSGNRVDPAYLSAFFQTPDYWAQVMDNLAGNAQPGCNATKLGNLDVPLPSLPEQREIVRRIGPLFGLADTIERRVAAATARTAKLAQAILAKAFRGELVPTEAELARCEGRELESAARLLERIRKARGEEAAGPKRNARVGQRRSAGG